MDIDLNQYAWEQVPLLALAVLLLAGSTCALFFRKHSGKRWSLSNFYGDESGAAYSLSFLMILPFYLLFLCIVLEVVFLLIGRMGTIHASLAAARAAVVHTTVAYPEERIPSPDDPLSGLIPYLARTKAQQAAVNALVPFASGFDEGATDASGADDYLDAYNALIALDGGSSRVRQESIRARYASARKRVRINLVTDSLLITTAKPWTRSVHVRVEYDAPFRLPYVGRLLGGEQKDGAVVKTCYAETTLQIECPQNRTGYTGVPIPSEIDLLGSMIP